MSSKTVVDGGAASVALDRALVALTATVAARSTSIDDVDMIRHLALEVVRCCDWAQVSAAVEVLEDDDAFCRFMAGDEEQQFVAFDD